MTPFFGFRVLAGSVGPAPDEDGIATSEVLVEMCRSDDGPSEDILFSEAAPWGIASEPLPDSGTVDARLMPPAAPTSAGPGARVVIVVEPALLRRARGTTAELRFVGVSSVRTTRTHQIAQCRTHKGLAGT